MIATISDCLAPIFASPASVAAAPRSDSERPDKRFLCFIFNRDVADRLIVCANRGWLHFNPHLFSNPVFGRWRDRRRPFHATRHEIVGR